MLQNVIGGLQGIVDHVMVGNFVGYTGNAAIGVSWQIFLVVHVFIVSLFTGMGVLVARFAGRNEPEIVNKVVYQAFLTALVLSLGILAPLGYFLAPALLDLVNAAPAVQAEALPYIRTLFIFSFGMMVFFMLGGALRSAGGRPDTSQARHLDDDAQPGAERDPDPGFGSDSSFRHPRGCNGNRHRGRHHGAGRGPFPLQRPLGDPSPPRHRLAPRPSDHPPAVPVRTAHRDPGRGHEHRRRDPPPLRRLAGEQCRSAGGRTRSATRSCSHSSPGHRWD